MKQMFIAFQFLTILPFRIQAAIREEDYARSLAYFPIVGMFIGSILSAVSLCSGFLPIPVTAVIILAVSACITGALHLDGFADTCDGFYGSRPREEILRIMRDPSCGAMGLVGLMLLLLFKFSLIISIPKETLWRVFIPMCCFSRWAQSMCCFLPYARTEGKAAFFIKHIRRQDIMIGGSFTLMICLVLFGIKGIALSLISVIPVLLFIRYSKAKIGGVTGDTLGAVNEIAESAMLFSIIALGPIWN
jgi:adenosylcobinamide-GDP ribazoletransferase